MTALPLVTIGKDGSFELKPDTLKKLSQLEGPVAVIAIAGLYRTGKSYLLNRLLGRQAGFAVGPTVNACTKGIYVWGDPPKRNGVNIILLDTEGLGSTQQDQAYDTKIFSLALLLSSYFIYNSMGTIDERALEGLHLVTNLTKHISTKSNTPMSAFMPNFIWCLRDFVLKLEYENGQPMTEAQYLENSLNFQPPKDGKKAKKSDDDKNAIRECIKTFFPRRDCACLVRPTTEESELQRIDSISESKLRPQFLKQMSELTEKILSGVQPKRIMNQAVTGERFVMLLQNYVHAFNSGMAPEILGTWESIAILENQKIVKSELSEYEKGLATAMKNRPLDDVTLTQANNALKLAAMYSIQKNGLGEDTSELAKEFEKFSAEIYRKVEKENLKASNETNSKLLEDLYKSFILQKLNQNEFANISKLSAAWNELEVHYHKIAKGAQGSRLQTLNRFLGTKKNESFSLYSEHIAKINQAEIENLKKISSELKKNAKETEKKLTDSLQLVSSEKHSLELNHVKSTEELKMLKERYQDSLNKIKEYEKRNEEQSQEHKNSIKKYEARIGELEEKVKESSAKEKKTESSHAEAKERIKKYESEIESLKKDINQARESEKKTDSNHSEAKERIKKYESDLESLKKQLRESDKKNESNDAGMKSTLKKKDSEIESLEKEVRSLKENDRRSEGFSNKIKETLKEREGEVEELKKEVRQLREFEKRHESSNQDWKNSLKKKDSEIESLEKEIRLLKMNEKNYENSSVDVKATMRKYDSDISSLKSEKLTLSNKLSGYELEMKEMRESNDRQLSSLQKDFNERLKQEKDQNNLLRLNNERLTSENRELENSVQNQQQHQQTPIRHSPTNQNMKKNTKKTNGSPFSFEQPQFLNDNNYDNEMDDEVPQATKTNQFQKLSQPVVSSPSKKRKQQAQLVVQEEEEPASKKQKKTADDLSRFTINQLRQKIKDIDHTKLGAMGALSKPKLIEILESLL
jgi:hypothetical protein